MISRLSEQDIKTIRYKKRTGYVLAGLVWISAAILDLSYAAGESAASGTVLVINTAILIPGILVAFFSNRKYNQDLQDGSRVMKTGLVQDKSSAISYEAGSGIYVPVLGDLFPRLWRRHAKSNEVFYLVINGNKYPVEKGTYENVQTGSSVIIYYSKYSDTLLEIRNAEEGQNLYPQNT